MLKKQNNDENDGEYTPSSDYESEDDLKNIIEDEYVHPPPQADELLPKDDNIAQHTRDKLSMASVNIEKLDKILYDSFPDKTPQPNIEYFYL